MRRAEASPVGADQSSPATGRWEPRFVALMREARDELHTNADLARAVGLAEGTIRANLGGKVLPSIETVARFVYWWPEQFEPAAMEYLHELGDRLSGVDEEGH